MHVAHILFRVISAMQ